jgi:hypothetical protein
VKKKPRHRRSYAHSFADDFWLRVPWCAFLRTQSTSRDRRAGWLRIVCCMSVLGSTNLDYCRVSRLVFIPYRIYLAFSSRLSGCASSRQPTRSHPCSEDDQTEAKHTGPENFRTTGHEHWRTQGCRLCGSRPECSWVIRE